uniref:RAB41, member RAS oncogene family n=1 Tax=Sinocyclocheilus anshuiensis TaxID=1608454 RepID=A0A671P0A0_9TELE
MSTTTGGGEFGNPLRKFKLVFLGEQSVGKTSLITRFMYDSFDNTYQATIGIDFLLVVSLSTSPHSLPWLGAEWVPMPVVLHGRLIPSYIRDSAAAVVVYDICFPQTCTLYVMALPLGGKNIYLYIYIHTQTLSGKMTSNRQITTEEGEQRTGYNVKQVESLRNEDGPALPSLHHTILWETGASCT